MSEDLLEDSTNRIEEFLRAQGYRDAAAPHARAEADGELIITFNVHKGPGVSRRARGHLGQHVAAALDIRAGPASA